MEPTVSACASVLIVDPSAESREVLRTVLQRRGVKILEATGGRQGLEVARRHHPGVIVLDVETVPDVDTRAGFQAESRDHSSALVVLATARRDTLGLPDGQVVSKPYHYGPLIRTIERLLHTAAAAEDRAG